MILVRMRYGFRLLLCNCGNFISFPLLSMNNPYRIFSLSIIGVFVFIFLPYASVDAVEDPSADRCTRLEGTDHYDRCIEHIHHRAERKAKHEQMLTQCGELEGEELHECKKNFMQENMPAELKEFKAKIAAACGEPQSFVNDRGEHPAKDADRVERQAYRKCAQEKSQELKDAGEYVPNKHGKGHSFGSKRRGQNHNFGFRAGRGFNQNIPEDVQAQIQSLMEQIRALMQQYQ